MGTHPIFESDFDCLTDFGFFEFFFEKKRKTVFEDVSVGLVYRNAQTARAYE